MTPRPWAYARVSPTRARCPRARAVVHPSSPARAARNTSPSRRPWSRGMVKYTSPSSRTPNSWTGTTPGWLSWPVIRASRRKRWARALSSGRKGVSPDDPRTTFIATDRRRFRSKTSSTEPIPPRPISGPRAYSVRGSRPERPRAWRSCSARTARRSPAIASWLPEGSSLMVRPPPWTATSWRAAGAPASPARSACARPRTSSRAPLPPPRIPGRVARTAPGPLAGPSPSGR